ncbi:unnamed protein product [Brassicogethes aeneus]|uniref:Hermansky-Pudlak syndrome 3 protein n=1 Tax=Brassicogethes aeneus TaxID=1431903 RepID=A0A9P0FCQ6_BRAAE|nr:unnamed protein product [Brassicogethes aeneus]
MVRVISVHHFASQNVETVEQPTACTVAPPNRFLLALTSNCIEVRDIKNESEVLFTFPTVDEVLQIVHCLNGDYVATLETKFNRQNRETNFVRVYINWDTVATLQQSKMTSSGVSLGSSECGMVQPMRARIAGRVTPTTNQSELGSLEMVEIPVKRNPNSIDCCQVSGNLIILSEKIINLYNFKVRTHDISKLRFIDFEEAPILIQLSFIPLVVNFCENYISCMSKDTFYLCRIFNSTQKDANNEQNIHENDFIKYCQDGPIDYKKLVKDELIQNIKEKITVNLPSILKDNSLIHKNNPFTFSDKEITASIKPNSPLDNKNQQYTIQNLIQLKLIPIMIESGQKSVAEEFKSVILKPVYIDENLNKYKSHENDANFFKSDYRKCLNSVVCMIATQQEGYMYHFDDLDSSLDKDNCIAIYPFTAPVYKIVMEDYFLHALTETGLESYTLRFGHQLCRNFEVIDNVNVACPPISHSICLVGLRPFLGVEQILLSENNLLLLANSDSSPTHSCSSNSSSNANFWTLYNLELPTPKTVFNDISIVANVHRFTSAQTYCHLMSEAHMVLRISLLLKKWTVTEDTVKLILTAKTNIDDVIETYRTSCALLGDHFVMCSTEEHYSLAIPYYKMARILPSEVLKRVKKVQEQSNNTITKGLMHYLRTILLDIKSGVDVDKCFGSGSKQNFSEAILNLLEVHGYEYLPNLILKSKIIREYSTDKLINILTEKIKDDSNVVEKNLALTILYIQKCNNTKALECLLKISNSTLFELLMENWELLFETTQNLQNKSKNMTTFSELSVILIPHNSDLISSVIVNLIVVKKVVNLNKIIKVFLEYLPSSIGSDGNTASFVLQKTLEQYFENYFSRSENADLSKITYERGSGEAMKLLVRSYLSQLQILQLKEDKCIKFDSKLCKNDSNEINTEEESDIQDTFSYNHINKIQFQQELKNKKQKDTYLFSSLRFEYLDKMPPFQVEITSKIYETCLENYKSKDFTPNSEADVVLKRLQALLCSQTVPKPILMEVANFLRVNENIRGSFSLKSIILGTNEAVVLLIDACPQCCLQFGKDRFTKKDEWKFLIATIQRRILKLSQNETLKRVCFFHKKILKDILTYVASSMTLDQLIEVFPQRFSNTNLENDNDNNKSHQNEDNFVDDLDILNEIQNYEPYVIICKETMHANQINKLITTTGQQLLCTLNL